MSGPADLIVDLELALQAAVQSGRHVRRAFGDPGEVRHKSPDQPVTAADVAVDRELRDRLMGARPDYGWLSEETTDDQQRLQCECVWMVDPIDGTSSFIAGLPESVISIGLARAGEAVLGVVHNPMTGELYWAVRDAGAYGMRLGVTYTAEDDEISLPEGVTALPAEDALEAILGGPWGRYTLIGAAHESGPAEIEALLVSRSEMDAGAYDALPANWRRIRRGSTAYKMSGVAAGVADGFVSFGGKSEWDVCAAALLISEAGGVVSDLSGAWPRLNRPTTRLNGVVAARDRRRHTILLGHLMKGGA